MIGSSRGQVAIPTKKACGTVRKCDYVTDGTGHPSYTGLNVTSKKRRYEMNPIVSFLASPAGRAVRILAGIALVVWGLWGLGSTAGLVVAIAGLVPLVAGLFDFCVFAPLFGAPLSGPRIRAGR
jgi:hypothetical protein